MRPISAGSVTRTSTPHVACPAATLRPVPPPIRPTLTVVPRSREPAPARVVTISASAWIALAPAYGSSPACASIPVTLTLNNPTPLRAVLSAPSMDASNTSVARASSLAASMCSREDGLPISSSPLNRNRTLGCGSPSSRRPRSAQTDCTSPVFMSKTPGPVALPSTTANGQPLSVPVGQTVS